MKDYKVIATFPGMERNYNIKNVGDILKDDEVSTVKDQNDRSIRAISFEDYPHIFENVTDTKIKK